MRGKSSFLALISIRWRYRLPFGQFDWRRADARIPCPEEGQATNVAPRSLSPSPDASPHELAARQELRRQINVALAQLQENRRRAVRCICGA